MADREVIYKGPGTLGLLGIVFIVLKLTGYIDWSWWWVTAPFWAPIALILGILAVLVIIVLIARLFVVLYGRDS